jgi:hypothetical protein
MSSGEGRAELSLSDIPPDSDVIDKHNLLAWHVAVVIVIGALLLLPDRLNDFVSRFYAAATVIGASAPAVMSLTAGPSDLPPWLLLAYCLAMHQAPLLILLGAIVFFADFRYSNVYVKNSLQLLTGLLLALGYCLLITGPLPPPEEIIFFRADGGIVRAYTATDGYWVNYQLNYLEACLPEEMFFRAHRSAIVNMTKVKEMRSCSKSSFLLFMSNQEQTEIKVSERQAALLRRRFPGL